VSDINNFVDPNAGVTSVAPAPVQAPAPPMGGGDSATRELGYYDVDNAAKGLQKLYNNYVWATSQILQEQVRGLNMWGGNKDGVAAAQAGAGKTQVKYELALAKVDSSIRPQVETLVKARGPAQNAVIGGFTTQRFRSGGGLRVMGSGAPDSRLVQMAVSPGEQIDVQTRKQRREEMGMLGGGNVNNNVTLNITTQDADSFRRSEKQIAQQARALLRRGA
jgi:hypothetical protein